MLSLGASGCGMPWYGPRTLGTAQREPFGRQQTPAPAAGLVKGPKGALVQPTHSITVCPTRGRVPGRPDPGLAAGRHVPMSQCRTLLLLALGLVQAGDRG